MRADHVAQPTRPRGPPSGERFARRVAPRRSRQACLVGTGRAPAGSPPQESNQQARRPATSQRATRRQFAHAKRCPRTHRMGGRALVPGVHRRLPNGGGTGIPRVGCGLERWGRHVAPPPCSLLTRTSTSYAWPWALSPDPRKGSTGQAPCSDVLVEAAHLASSRPVLNRYYPDAVLVTQSAVVEPSDGGEWRKLRADRPKVLRVVPSG